jgi:hypothetical protein
MLPDLEQAAKVATKLRLMGAEIIAVVPMGDIILRLPNSEYKRVRIGDAEQAWTLIEVGFELGWAQHKLLEVQG